MTTAPPSSGRSAGIARLAAIGLACLVAGFVVGWFVRGDGGDASVLPVATAPVASGTTTGTTTGGTPPPAPAPLPRPAAITLAVLNGTTINGFAAQTAARAESLGYPTPTAGNAPTGDGPTVVYFREGRRPAARRVARDLGFTAVRPLPASGAIAEAAPDGADVVVVLGPG